MATPPGANIPALNRSADFTKLVESGIIQPASAFAAAAAHCARRNQPTNRDLALHCHLSVYHSDGSTNYVGRSFRFLGINNLEMVGQMGVEPLPRRAFPAAFSRSGAL